MAIIKYLVEKEKLKEKYKLINEEEPVVMIGTKKEPLYIITVGSFCGDIYISVYDISYSKIQSIEETLVEDKSSLIESVEDVVAGIADLIDSREEEELEESSFYVCDNTECTEHVVVEPLYLNGEWVCPECGEVLREVSYDEDNGEIKEIDPERLKDIAAMLISGIIDDYGASVFQIESEYGITLEEIEYVTGS